MSSNTNKVGAVTTLDLSRARHDARNSRLTFTSAFSELTVLCNSSLSYKPVTAA